MNAINFNKQDINSNFNVNHPKLMCISMALCPCAKNSCQLSRIAPIDSQVLTVYYGNFPLNITLDSGATVSFVLKSTCDKLKIKTLPNGQLARLGDGCTLLASQGEIDVNLTRNKWSVRLRAIVVDKLNSECYGGMTFLHDNDIQTRPLTGEITVHGKYTLFQTNTIMSPPQIKNIIHSSFEVELPHSVLFSDVMPFYSEIPSVPKYESTLNVTVPEELKNETYVLVEPINQNHLKNWPKEHLSRIEMGKIKLTNSTRNPISAPFDIKTVKLSKVTVLNAENLPSHYESNELLMSTNLNMDEIALKNAMSIDISRAPKHLQKKLYEAHLEFATVFAPDLSQGYNGKSGKHTVQLRFADESRPQMAKCHIPRWSGKDDQIKQKKMDDLERQGVLLDPYKENIPIKLISPSFLRIKARAKEKNIEDCDISEIRWIISPCQLNPYLRQLHVNNITKEDMFVFKSEKKYCIEFDCYEGYFQNHVDREDWGY